MVVPANQQVRIAAFDMRKGLRSETGTIITNIYWVLTLPKHWINSFRTYVKVSVSNLPKVTQRTSVRDGIWTQAGGLQYLQIPKAVQTEKAEDSTKGLASYHGKSKCLWKLSRSRHEDRPLQRRAVSTTSIVTYRARKMNLSTGFYKCQ